MNYFASALREIMTASGITGASLAEKTDLDPATISRLLNGDRPRVDLDELRRIVEAMPTAKPKAQLLVAHLQDERAGLDLGVTVTGPRGATDYLLLETADIPLPPPEHEVMELLRANIMSDRDLRAVLTDLAKLFKRIPKKKDS